MMKAIVLPNIKKDEGLAITRTVVRKLTELGIASYIEDCHRIASAFTYDVPPDDVDYIIVVGGDGSVIDASRLAVDLDVPLLGINLGKVGYLTTLDPDNLDMLSGLVNKDFIVSEKMLLAIEKHGVKGEVLVSDRLALNDVIVSHDSYLGIADFKVENAGGDSVVYRADGVVIATPAGSTAYSLSAGGPIISHTLDSIMVTPLCPHSFFNRSIVYGPEEKIRITNLSDIKLNISVDGRLFSSLPCGESCIIRRSERRVKLLTFSESNLFATLSEKIKLMHD